MPSCATHLSIDEIVINLVVADPLWPASYRCALPVLPVSDPLRFEVHPLSERPSPRSQAGKFARQC